MKPLNHYSGMPQISSAFMGWMTNITLGLITQEIIDGLTVDTQTDITFKGVIQPLKPQEIALKPEGLRDWIWLQIHCFSGILNLEPNDRIIYNGVKYKVMGIKDYSLDNYIEYHVIQDYQNE